MTIQVGKNKNAGLTGIGSGSGKTSSYVSPLDRHFQNGGTIWNAPSSNSNSGSNSDAGDFGGGVDGAKGATATANSGTANLNAANAQATAASADVHTTATRFNAQTFATIKLLAKKGQEGDKLGKQDETISADIQDLTAQRDAAAAEGGSGDNVTDAPSTDAPSTGGNPFDGTGSGKGSAFSLDLPDSGNSNDIPANGGDNADPKSRSHAYRADRPTPGEDNGNDTPPTTPPAAAPTDNAGSTGNSGNTEANTKVADLDSQITAKTGEKEQVENDINAQKNQARSVYTSRLNGLKADGSRLDGKIADAQNKAANAQMAQQTAGQITQTGQTVTGTGVGMIATGSAMEASPATAAAGAALITKGTIMTSVGGVATAAGIGMNLAAASSLNSAKQEQVDATNAQGQLKQRRSVLAESYRKEVKKLNHSA